MIWSPLPDGEVSVGGSWLDSTEEDDDHADVGHALLGGMSNVEDIATAKGANE
jgi:hypothetical protein